MTCTLSLLINDSNSVNFFTVIMTNSYWLWYLLGFSQINCHSLAFTKVFPFFKPNNEDLLLTK
jgi:hypothetical protein